MRGVFCTAAIVAVSWCAFAVSSGKLHVARKGECIELDTGEAIYRVRPDWRVEKFVWKEVARVKVSVTSTSGSQ